MTKEFRLKDPGEGIHEAEIKEIHIVEGDDVADGDTILSVETDKAAVEIPAPFAGVIEEIRVDVGDIVEVGSVIITYSETGGSKEKTEEAEAEEGAERKSKGQQEKGHKKSETSEKEAPPDDEGEQPNQKCKPEVQQETEESKTKAPKHKGPVPASPATRRLARELEIDLAAVHPSGAEGRVTGEDVRSAAEQSPSEASKKEQKESEQQASKPGKKRTVAATPELPDFEQWGEIERIPLRSIRRATARQMSLSWSQIPHVTHQDEADITELEQWRWEHKTLAEETGGKLTLTVLIMKALVAALKEFPRFNASLDSDNEEIVLKHHYHIGIAVDTDQGLVVPVVRDVDRKSILEISSEVVALAEKARDGDLTRDDMQGGTITITNPGPIGGRVFTPIIDYPQVAILGLGQARLEPKVKGDLDEFEIVPRLILPLCLAFDHRVNDGADAARFVNRLADTLSKTETVLLTV